MRTWRAAAAVAGVMVFVAACGGGADTGAESGTLTVWTMEDQAERVTAQKEILAGFTQATGIQVELVAVAADQLTPVLTSAAAANELPDVIGALSLNGVNQLRNDDLLDTEVAASVVEALGENTFSPAALDLTRKDGEQLAVPSDAYTQLLLYRKDLFAKAGLPAPDTYEAITSAAAALDQGEMAGIVAATAPADSFTHQTFEHLALANGCQLVDNAGEVRLASPECVESFQFYTDLIRNYSMAGNQDADTTRAAYFAGKAAMVLWSSFLLDELAGLRNDARPTCPECVADPTFLAKNTGIITAIQGPRGPEPVTFGEIVSWAVLRDANPEAQALIEYVMNDGYEDWIAIGPEGKVPVRSGTPDQPDKFTTSWQGMQAGVDTKAPLSNFYDAAVLKSIATSPQQLTRWGQEQGHGALAAAMLGQFVVPKALADAINSGTDSAQAARSAADQARRLQDEIG